MAEYKVAQDVEADDKLIGPFSFRQFIYLIVVAGASAIAWGLAQVFVPLAILPLPVILLFGALALPLRKDQPMEIYLAAIVSFHLKPRNRIWSPDGISSLIEIVAPEEIEVLYKMKKLFTHMSDYLRSDPYIGEAAIVIEVLHGNLTGKVAEEGNNIVGTVISSGIA